MAEWKKVIVSGSRAELLDASGSFSGSFFGDGSGLSGVAASFPTTYLTPADATKVFVNDGASKFTSASALADYTFGKISGDATVAAGGALTIANNAVELSMIAEAATGSILNTIAGDVNVSTGGVSTIQANAVELSMIAEAATGSILDTIAGDVNVDAGGVSTLAATIPNNKTFSGNVITINNDLVVQGTASFQNTQNLVVADKFILLNSGSATDNSPGGFVVQQDTQNVGVLFGYDAAAASNDGRFGVTSSFAANSSTFTADAYVAMVIDEDASQTDIALYQQRGNIKIDTSDNIYIYV